MNDEPYPDLLREKGFGGFPSLCFMDADGNIVAQQQARTVVAFKQGFEQVREPVQAHLEQRQDLEARAKAGDAAAARQLFLADLAMLTEAEIKAGMRQHEFGKDELARVDQALTDLELKAILARKDSPDRIARDVAMLAKAGRRPSSSQAMAFWTQTLQYVVREKDGPFAAQILPELDALAAGNRSLQARLAQLRQLAEQVKAK